MRPLGDKLVLVTGAAGFIGSHVAEELARRGARVRALVRYNSRGSAGWLDEMDALLRPRIDVRAGDVRDAQSVRSAMRGCDAVLHLAALIGIPYSYEAPEAYVAVNVGGTLNVLEAARELGVARVVHTSTSEVYGTALSVPIREDHPLQAQSPYAASKIAADKLAESYHRSFGLPVVTLRPFNTFGPRQSERAVVPVIAAQIVAGARDIRLGAVEPTRDMNYVANTVDAFIAALLAPESCNGAVFNAGSGHEVSIGDLAGMLAERAGTEIKIVLDERRLRPRLSEVERLVADSTAARERLGWKPRVSLEEGLDRVLAWMRERSAPPRPGDYVV